MLRKEPVDLPLRIGNRPDLLMPSWQRRKTLQECVNNQRSIPGDILAKIALDEIEDLDMRVQAQEETINKLKKGVKVT